VAAWAISVADIGTLVDLVATMKTTVLLSPLLCPHMHYFIVLCPNWQQADWSWDVLFAVGP
jgi:hypothetical protein